MKLKDKKQIFEKSEKELIKDLKAAKEALFNLKLEKSQNKLKNTKSLFWKKKEIAWILTALKEKELLAKKNNI
ncbi:MAG: 50S ribosomal protein L29 [Patescibacteria group bacterium]